MQKIIEIRTTEKNALYDITAGVEELVRASGVRQGLCSVYARKKREVVVTVIEDK